MERDRERLIDAEMRDAGVDHPENRGEHASNRADLAAIGISGARQAVIVAKQFVRAVDQINVQGLLARAIIVAADLKAASSESVLRYARIHGELLKLGIQIHYRNA